MNPKWSELRAAALDGPPVMRRVARFYFIGMILPLAGAIGVIFLREWLHVHDAIWARFGPLILGVLPLAVVTPIAWWKMRRIRRAFDEAEGRICTFCAYNLTGLPEGAATCPECGRRASADDDARAWRSIGFRKHS